MTATLEPGPLDDHDDLDLITRARDEDPTAVEELYRRHQPAALRLARQLTDPVTAEDVVAEAFARVLAALGSGHGPSQAFRPYLLVAVRNAYVSHVRRDSRYLWTEDDSAAALTPVAADPAHEREESRVLAEAFGTLPERWQAVLWHTTVEGEDHETVGRLLGIKANAVAALAFRAREGLRRAYLGAHLAASTPERCRPVREQLPAYVRGRVPDRERERIDQHLRDCTGCTAAVVELGALNSGLGAVLAPALLGSAGTGYAAAGGGGALGLGPIARILRSSGRTTLVASTAAAACVVAAVAAVALVVHDEPSGGVPPAADPTVAGAPTARAEVTPTTTRRPAPVAGSSSAPAAADAGDTAATAVTPAPVGATATLPTTLTESEPGTTRPPSPSGSPSASTTPVASASVPSPTAPSPTAPSVPTPTGSPTGSPTPPTTTEDLSLGAASHAFYGPHHHLQMQVTATLDPTVVTFDVAGLVSHTVHQDLGFTGTTCTPGPSALGRTTLTCVLAPGTGTFAVDVVVSGPLDVTGEIGADGNLDPDPSNDTVHFAD